MRSAPYRLRNWHAATGLLHEPKHFIQCGFAVLARHRRARERRLRSSLCRARQVRSAEDVRERNANRVHVMRVASTSMTSIYDAAVRSAHSIVPWRKRLRPRKQRQRARPNRYRHSCPGNVLRRRRRNDGRRAGDATTSGVIPDCQRRRRAPRDRSGAARCKPERSRKADVADFRRRSATRHRRRRAIEFARGDRRARLCASTTRGCSA